MWTRCVLLLALGCTHRSTPARAHHDAGGAVEFRASCAAPVRADFDRAVTFLHHMTYPQAREAFRDVARRDPTCAIAHWGIAMTLFTPLWPTRPSPAELKLGWEEAQRARALATSSPRERGFIDAVAAFFSNPEAGDYWDRIDRWAAAMKTLHDKFPDDVEVTAFYALALLATARPGPSVQEHSQQAVALLLPIHQRYPAHPGAMHYIIHANDVTGRERENLDIVRHYEQVAPDNPHALHMPTHIYTRLGDWDGVIRGNLRAADAALRYPTGEHGELVWDEFPHAIEYLVYAYLQEGDDEKAKAQIDRLFAMPKLEPSAKTAFHLASTRARYTLERHAWAEAAALVPGQPPIVEWSRFPWPDAVMWFAHGYGALRNGDKTEPPRALAQLRELEARATSAGEPMFARQIQMLRLMLDGWSAHAARDDDKALALLREVAELERTTPKPPVTPAATLPANELLGDLLLELGRASDAVAAYREALALFPRRFNTTLGLARALASSGDAAAAAQAYCELAAIGARGSRLAKLPEVRCAKR